MAKDLWAVLATVQDVPAFRHLLTEFSSEELISVTETALVEVIGANFAGYNAPSRLPAFISHDLAVSELRFDFNEPYHKVRWRSEYDVYGHTLRQSVMKCPPPHRIWRRSLPLLFLAKEIFLNRSPLNVSSPRANLLKFRVLLLWQKFLREPCAVLKDLMDECAEQINADKLKNDEKVQYLLERANAHLIFYDYEKCSECIKMAFESSGLEVELAGKMGKRTRFQKQDIAQLVLNMQSAASAQVEGDGDVPTNCALSDDTLLENISLAEKDSKSVSVSSLQLAVVLSLFRLEWKSEHCDELFMERADAYLEAIIHQRRCWPVQTAALLARCELERRKNRRVERACAQAELVCKLLDGISDETPEDVKLKRCGLVLASGLDPFWEAHVIHAETLRSLGCTAEALLIYEKLEMWDHVIECFKQLGQLQKAESLIRKLLLDRPDDSMLYCYLGDITMESSYYQTAIKMSNDHNARARKSFGSLMLLRNQFESAYEHLRRSLELQPIQEYYRKRREEHVCKLRNTCASSALYSKTTPQLTITGGHSEGCVYLQQCSPISQPINVTANFFERQSSSILLHSLYCTSLNGESNPFKKDHGTAPCSEADLGVWFNAGYCAWKLERYADAVTCFHRCVTFEPEHFEAWSNLSAAYIKLGQMERAVKILQEALKFNYEHPKVWENYLLLCVDTAQFEQAIKAFHRLLDLNKQQKDDEVLEIIAKGVLRMCDMADDEKSKTEVMSLKAELVKLFGRISSVQTLSSKAWKAYAMLKRPKDDNVEEAEKYMQLLERALLADSNQPNWSKDVERCSFVLSLAIELASERLRVALLKSDDAVKQAKLRVRMSLRALATTAKKEYGDQLTRSDEGIAKIRQLLSESDRILMEVSL